jgi:hypothetical protein
MTCVCVRAVTGPGGERRPFVALRAPEEKVRFEFLASLLRSSSSASSLLDRPFLCAYKPLTHRCPFGGGFWASLPSGCSSARANQIRLAIISLSSASPPPPPPAATT